MVTSLLENKSFDKSKQKIRCVIRSEAHREDLEDFEDEVEVVIGDIKKEKANGPVFEGVNVAYFAVPNLQGRLLVGSGAEAARGQMRWRGGLLRYAVCV